MLSCVGASRGPLRGAASPVSAVHGVPTLPPLSLRRAVALARLALLHLQARAHLANVVCYPAA